MHATRLIARVVAFVINVAFIAITEVNRAITGSDPRWWPQRLASWPTLRGCQLVDGSSATLPAPFASVARYGTLASHYLGAALRPSSLALQANQAAVMWDVIVRAKRPRPGWGAAVTRGLVKTGRGS